MIEKTIAVDRLEHIMGVFGSFDQNLRIIEDDLDVTVVERGDQMHITGEAENVMLAEQAINGLLSLSAKGESIDAQNVRYILKLVREGKEDKIGELAGDVICITAKGKPIKPKTLGQKEYCEAIAKNTGDREKHGHARYRPCRYRKNLSRCSGGCGGLSCRAGQPHYPDASCGRGRRTAGLSPRRSAEQGRSVSQTAV